MSKRRLFQASRENYVTTLAKLFEYATDNFAGRPMARFVDGGQEYTYESFKHKCLELSQRFNRFGISAGDKVAILSNNMPNWTVAMFSCVPFGRVTVPILPDSSESEVTNILTHSGCKAIFISKRMLKKLSDEVKDKMTLVIDIETFELIKKDDHAFTCEGHGADPQADDLASIIYTSGTSGKAKGVMLSHRNFCRNIIAAYHAQKAGKKDRWLSILPMSHTYEMAFSVLYPLYVGGCVYYIQKPPTPSILMKAMKDVRPTIMCAVPLIIEKIYKNSVVPTVEKSKTLSWLKKKAPRLLYWMIGKKLYKTFGGKLTHEQTRYIFETNTIGMTDAVLNVNDILETVNHFRCIDLVIEHATDDLSTGFIKELHGMLKNGTSDSRKDWFAVGDYKRLPNEVGGEETCPPEQVAERMDALLDDYLASERRFEDILDLHVRFERIHPFQDGNGRVGRLVMFKECLANAIVPFIITDELKFFYYRGLREWGHINGYLTDTCLTAQDQYKTSLDYFRIQY